MKDGMVLKGMGSKFVHAGQKSDPVTGAISAPIYLTSAYEFTSVEDGAKKCESFNNGYCYTRLGNPTQAVLEEKVAILEGAEAGLAFASGVAAISAVLLSQLKGGDHAVVSDTTYSASHYLFETTLRKFGVECDFVDATDPEKVRNAVRSNTRMLYFETPANPTVKLIDIRAMVEIAKAHNIMTVVDSTFATPYLQRPIEMGVNVVIHSATKYLCGHGDAMGGIVVGRKKLMDEIRDDTMKNVGGIISPTDAFLIIRGIKTLEVRMKKHCENAMKVAVFLEAHPKVSRVYYPGLSSHPQHEIAKKQMDDFGGMITFEVKGGIEAGVKLMESIKMCLLAVNLGDTATLLQHPASMTHWYVPREERLKGGITDGMVRMSIGIESVEDIIYDLEQALAQI